MVAELSDGPDPLERRARHVVSENLRVEHFVDAASAADLKRMGQLFVESHRSLQQDYEVSCEELDFLVDTALTIPGVWGARMTGGGFGGCTVNLVDPAQGAAFREHIAAAYRRRYQIEPQIYTCRPSSGAGAVSI
jgi:galactokinase